MDNRKNMLRKVTIIVFGINCYKMRQIIWSQAIKCYICMHKNFKVDSKFNRANVAEISSSGSSKLLCLPVWGSTRNAPLSFPLIMEYVISAPASVSRLAACTRNTWVPTGMSSAMVAVYSRRSNTGGLSLMSKMETLTVVREERRRGLPRSVTRARRV